MFLTVPVSTMPSERTWSVCFFFSSRSSSSTDRRESTTLPQRRLSLITLERLDRDRPFALVADVDEDLARADVDHAAADHHAFLELGHAGLVSILHAFLGPVTALPTRSAEMLPWFVLLHTARSSSHFICP